jgi:hypothetical protein
MSHSQGANMDTTRRWNYDLETIAWGVFFIWWGITDADVGLFRSLPPGTGWIGVGLILIGLNVVRALNGTPTNGFSITLGILALVLGGLKLASSLLTLPFDIPIYAILLVVLGVILLTRELLRARKEGFGEVQ